MGRFEEATAAAQKAGELSGRNARTQALFAGLYALLGRQGEARAILKELTTQSRTAYVPPRAIAPVYAGLGEVDLALEWVEKGIEERDLMIINNLKYKQMYAPLHGHPRYQALLRKMNL